MNLESASPKDRKWLDQELDRSQHVNPTLKRVHNWLLDWGPAPFVLAAPGVLGWCVVIFARTAGFLSMTKTELVWESILLSVSLLLFWVGLQAGKYRRLSLLLWRELKNLRNQAGV